MPYAEVRVRQRRTPQSSSALDQYRFFDKDVVNTDHRIDPPLPVKIANRTLSSSCAHRFRQIRVVNQRLHRLGKTGYQGLITVRRHQDPARRVQIIQRTAPACSDYRLGCGHCFQDDGAPALMQARENESDRFSKASGVLRLRLGAKKANAFCDAHLPSQCLPGLQHRPIANDLEFSARNVGQGSNRNIQCLPINQPSDKDKKRIRANQLSGSPPWNALVSTPFSFISITLPRTPVGSAFRVRSLATSNTAACFLPGSRLLPALVNNWRKATAARLMGDSLLRKASGKSIPPFRGPITTGMPMENSADGKRGEIGIG